jgi:hypothetical protein
MKAFLLNQVRGLYDLLAEVTSTEALGKHSAVQSCRIFPHLLCLLLVTRTENDANTSSTVRDSHE